MTNRHEEILAKSERNGSVSLYQHLKDVAELAVVIASHEGMDQRTALFGALLHDIGKTSSVFQKTLKPTFHPLLILFSAMRSPRSSSSLS